MAGARQVIAGQVALAAVAGVLALCACHSRQPPAPQSSAARQQEATEAERKAAAAETEMNREAQSGTVDQGATRDRGRAASEAPPPPR